jgi:putative redox protein
MANFTVTYQGQLRTQATHIASGTQILTDAPVDNHGRGEAFSPTDLVCIALATCIITTVDIWAEREQLDLTDTTLDITKTMQASPRLIAQIDITMNFKNKNLTDEQKQKIEHIAHTCPVAKSLHPDLKQNININYQ